MNQAALWLQSESSLKPSQKFQLHEEHTAFYEKFSIHFVKRATGNNFVFQLLTWYIHSVIQ